MNTETMTKTMTKMNGLDRNQMFETISAIKSDSSLAHFEFRAKNQWVDGGMNRSTVQGFYGAGREDDSRKEPFVWTNGEPPVLLGNNEGGNPVEYLLHAIAGCVTTTFVLHAAARGIEVRQLSTKLSGNIDMRGLLGLDENIPAGYESITIKMKVDADCSEEELDDLMKYVHGHSPTCNTVCRPVPVNLVRVKD